MSIPFRVKNTIAWRWFSVVLFFYFSGTWLVVLCADDDAVVTQPAWKLVDIPQHWKRNDRNAVSQGGFAWYRCKVEVPESWQEQSIELFVEAVDDAREIFFNGHRIGGLGTFPPEYRSGLGVSLRFPVDQKHVLFGDVNVVSIRVCRIENRGGFNVAAPVLFADSKAIRMKGKWETSPGDNADWGKVLARTKISKDAQFSNELDRQEVEATLKKLDDEAGPQSIAKSLSQIKVPEDLTVELAVGEPHVRQPLSMKWDERGRLWVMQYLQYPDPAGLKMVSRDKYLRTVYDRVPAPPPHHDRGNDKITIHEDTDNDGVYDRHKTFVDGLNLATSFAIGRGGVFVLNPPYLLFYPDHDKNDQPDGDPTVLLEGFGLEDTHSIANSIQWGPDGWLYACQGSTVSGNIRRYGSDEDTVHSKGQLVWRYHPESKRYEVFAEGGGNTFGLEIDSKGRIFSGHNGGDTRGFHYVQGGYSRKGFGKHGPLSNPFAFGYFPPIAHHKVERFTHVFVINEGNGLPEKYDGTLFGVGPLQGHVVASKIDPDGSTYKTKDIGHPFVSQDSWCRPVDIKIGPDGAIYVADMYEQRIDHSSHYQGRIHRDSGRIWRIRSQEPVHLDSFDLAAESSRSLVGYLNHQNKWFRQEAVRIFADRKDQSIVPLLKQTVQSNQGDLALNALWALHVSGGLDEPFSLSLLDHEDPFVRLWTVRLNCDSDGVTETFAVRMAQLAKQESNVQVRSQLACSARRIHASYGLPIVKQLLAHNEDVGDTHIPLLLWWAIEANVAAHTEEILEMFSSRPLWETDVVRQHILDRLMRRYASSGTRKDLIVCGRILKLAPNKEYAKKLLISFESAFQGRSLGRLPDELVSAIASIGGGSLELRIRQSDTSAIREALRAVTDVSEKESRRVRLIGVLGDTRAEDARSVLLDIATSRQSVTVRVACLNALQAFADDEIGAAIVQQFPAMEAELREVAESLLASRKPWAIELLNAVDRKTIPTANVSKTTLRKILLFQDDVIERLVKQHWGTVDGTTNAEMVAELQRVTDLLSAGSGIPHSGKPLFIKNCGKCHKLFDDGGSIGPDLTAFQRTDLRRVLVNVVNPSIEIREGYETYVIVTTDGQVLTGFVDDQDNQIVVLRTAEGATKVVARDEIDEMNKVPRSIMPEGLLSSYSDQQIRDLFAYLRSPQPLP